MNTATIGIDFGTTTSSMAWVDPRTGEAKVIKNAEGEEKTPSVVWFGADSVLVGTPAEQLLEDPDECQRVVQSIKRELISAPTLALPGRRVKPAEIAAAIFAKLKRDAEELHFHAPVDRAVVTCPAAFDLMEREAIEQAARLAGFTEVRTLEEPVAAALAYSRAGLGVGRHVLVYDLGGGTFDLALLRQEAEGFALALPPRGLRRCGGDDFDEALYEYCDTEAERQWGQPLNGAGRDLKFLRDCRKRKENLSTCDKVLFSGLVGEGRVFRHTLTRDLFEGLISARVETTVRETGDLVRTAQAEGCAVETVVLIGGSVRIPLVQRRLKESLPAEPRKWQHQDVAVALGAAYQAQGLWAPRTTSAAKKPERRPAKNTVEPLPAVPSASPTQSARPAAPPPVDRQAVLTPQDIHGWPAERVQTLQRSVAEVLGLPVVFRVPLKCGGQGPEMVVIPPGAYLMGAADNDNDAYGDEKPQHRVRIARPFAIGHFAVTFDEYDLFCVETARSKPRDQGWGRGRRPVINVSWEDAVAYCAWLSVQTGRTYRLPTESEWEYPARAGTSTRYWWGSEIGRGNANCDGGGSQWDNKQTAPVGSFKPNPFGLYDTAGNVWEWIQDEWHDNYSGAPGDGSEWMLTKGFFKGIFSDARRVVRGGSWIYDPSYARVSFRYWGFSGLRYDFFGLRIAQDL
ncbi:Hsp70 family protein [uncultured Thiodictyon sp.]|jgi:formylglycine-generating enzyme required for sulfatase activity|uniref:Hsp70 family protein n=1 Tax=uncultured Thiodictyon sp. TaxID=1846217 RepID=UPI0025E4D2AC|nr:Hsp70 family protein [uncultured Thiodictyon sp.]